MKEVVRVHANPSSPLRPANLEQQRKLAKDLLRAARDGDAGALARIRAVRSDAGEPRGRCKLADAQLAIAREAGFESWPKLVADFQERDVKAFREAVRRRRRGPRAATRSRWTTCARAINDPMFAFGQRAAHIAAKNAALLTLLLDAGADVNLKSDWENGPLHRARQRRRGHGALPARARRDADAERRGAARLVRRAAGARRRRSARSSTRAAATASSRSTRRRPSAIADFLLDHGADIDVPLHRSQVDAGAVRAGRSARRLPAPARARRDARHLHGRPARRPRARHASARRRPGLRRRARQRARLCARAAVQHLLLVARLRPVAARRRDEVRPSRRARPARRRAARRASASSTRSWPRDEPAAKAVLAEDPSLLAVADAARSTATWRTRSSTSASTPPS